MIDDQETAPTRAYVDTLHQEIVLLRGQLQGIPPVQHVAVGLQTVSPEALQEALQLLPSVMRPSMSNTIISAINEQAATIDRMQRTSHARKLAFDAAMLQASPSHHVAMPPQVTKEIVEAFYRAHDSSLENQPREYHQAIFDGIAAALKAATSSAAYPSAAPRETAP